MSKADFFVVFLRSRFRIKVSRRLFYSSDDSLSHGSWWVSVKHSQTERLASTAPTSCPRLRLAPFPYRWVNTPAVSARLLRADPQYLHLICELAAQPMKRPPGKNRIEGGGLTNQRSVRPAGGGAYSRMRWKGKQGSLFCFALTLRESLKF